MNLGLGNTDKNSHGAVDVRQALADRLPAYCQELISRFTGKGLQDQTLPSISPTRHMVCAWFWYVAGISCGVAASISHKWVLLGPAWIMSVHGARKLQLTIVHYCAHGTMYRGKLANVWLGRATSLLLLITEFDKYKQGHVKHHTPNLLSTMADPTMQFLLRSGIKPGLSKGVLWRRLILGMLSPRLQARVFGERIRSHFVETSLAKRAVAALYMSSLLAVGLAIGWLPLFLSLVVPLVWLYQSSQLLRLCVEHRWEVVNHDRRTPEELKELTTAVFMGAAPPAANLALVPALVAWVRWILAMLGHAFGRVCVMVGDTPCHDDHHFHPSRDWTNYVSSRQRNLQRANEQGLRDYTEVWGLLKAIDSNLENFSNCLPFDQVHSSKTNSELVYDGGYRES